MNKKKLGKVTGVATASFLIAGTTAFTAFAAMPSGTAVIGTKAYDLNYVNDPANQEEITAAMVAADFKVYVKDFAGNWIVNETEAALTDLSVIPAVQYKSSTGVVTNYDVKDGAVVTNNGGGTTNPGSLSVESISAINTRQIMVKFATTVDLTTSQNLASYKLNGTTLAGTDTKAKRLSDKKTVIITLDNATYAYAQGTVKTFVVNENAVQENNTGLYVAGKTQDITFSDVTAPTVSSVTVSGNKTIYVAFSEALNKSEITNPSNYKIDGQPLSAFGGNVAVSTGYYGVAGNLDILSNGVTLSFDAAIPAGSHTLTVGGGVTIKDTANFTLTPVDKSFTVNNVTSEPTITTITAATSGKVVVVFSEAMDATSIGSSAFTVGATTVTGAVDYVADPTGKTVNLNFGAGIVKAGPNVLEITKNTLKDVYGNVVAPTLNSRTTFTADSDKVAPVIDNVYPISDTTIRVKFSELVDPVYFTNANFTLKDASGNKIYGGTATAWNGVTPGADNSVVDLSLTTVQAAKLGKAQYTLEVKNVADTAGNVMTTATKTFTTVDNENPTLLVGASNLLINTTNRTATVLFNEPMDTASIGNIANYLYAPNGSAFAALPGSCTVTVASNAKSATIAFPTTVDMSTWNGTAKIRVIGVKDAATNVIKTGMEDTSAAVLSSTANNPAIKSATAKVYSDSNKVWVTFDTDQVLDVIDKNDFKAGVSGSDILISSAGTYTPDSATRVGNTVTLTWTTSAAAKTAIKANSASVKFPATTTYVGTLNSEGAALKTGASALTAYDYVVPELVATTPIKLTAPNTITIQFNEALKNIPASFADDFVVVVNGTVVPSAYVDSTLNTAGASDTVTLTLSGYSSSVPANVLVKFAGTVDLADTSDNKFAPSALDLAGYNPTGAFAAPAAPTLTANDVTNTVVGSLDATMEYSYDGGAYVAYSAPAFAALNFSGAHTLNVRVAANAVTGAPAGAATTLTFTNNLATAPVSATLAAGGTNGVGGAITPVVIPAAGATDATGVAAGWVTGTADTIKFTVVDGGAATSTITINGTPYASGADYTVGGTGTITIVVTTTEAGMETTVRTFTVNVTA